MLYKMPGWYSQHRALRRIARIARLLHHLPIHICLLLCIKAGRSQLRWYRTMIHQLNTPLYVIFSVYIYLMLKILTIQVEFQSYVTWPSLPVGARNHSIGAAISLPCQTEPCYLYDLMFLKLVISERILVMSFYPLPLLAKLALSENYTEAYSTHSSN